MFTLVATYLLIGVFSELVFHRAEQDEFGDDLPRDFRASATRFFLWPIAWYHFLKSGLV